MVHEVTVRIVNVAKSSRFGLSKIDHGQDYRLRLRERATSNTWVCTDGWVPARAVLAFLLWVADERAVCVFPLGWY